MIRDVGVRNLSLRNLAAACNTSTTAVYSLFGNKENLVDSVGERVFGSLRSQLDAVDSDEGALVALRSMLRLYRIWALENEHFFRAFFQGLDFSDDALETVSRRVTPMLERVKAGQANGEIHPSHGSAGDVMFGIWVIFHGFISLELRFRRDPTHDVAVTQLGEERFLTRIDRHLTYLANDPPETLDLGQPRPNVPAG